MPGCSPCCRGRRAGCSASCQRQGHYFCSGLSRLWIGFSGWLWTCPGFCTACDLSGTVPVCRNGMGGAASLEYVAQAVARGGGPRGGPARVGGRGVVPDPRQFVEGRSYRPTFWSPRRVTTLSGIRRAGRVGCRGRSVSFLPLSSIWAFSGSSTTPSFFPFIIPKSSRKVSLILSCVGLNEESPDPPHFALPSWEGICRLSNQTSPGRRLYATHMNLTNAFWSFVLLEGVDKAFRARVRPGGPVVGATRLPFGWKFSPYLCQRILGDLLRLHIPQGVELLHYLDDFVLVSTDCPLLHGTTQECVRVLVENQFIVSDKSTLEPVQHLFVLGKFLDLPRRMIYSHRRAWLQILAAWLKLAVSPLSGPKLMEKLLGFLQWHIRPRLTSAPLLAGAYCWVRWGDHDRNVPVKILHALASTLCLCAKPYRALP